MSLKSTVRKEIQSARKRGEPWTAIRRFIRRSYEHIGGVYCYSSAHPGRRPAVAVSYCTGFPGRCVYCEKCFKTLGGKESR